MTKKKNARVWGYARVSTDDQNLTSQIDALKKWGVPDYAIWQEKKSGRNNDREMLNWLLRRIVLRRGDTIVVTKLDRLGRSLTGLIEIVELIEQRGAVLVSIGDNIDTTTATGKFFFHIIAAMAQWERDMISERTRDGIAAQKAAGKKFGRKPLIWHNGHGSERRIEYLREMENAGELREEIEGVTVLIPKAEALMVDLNKPRNRAKGDRDIENAETVRRWVRQGWQGLEDG
jgi:DNA invertase Pin-like site-specific DNA recombinase